MMRWQETEINIKGKNYKLAAKLWKDKRLLEDDVVTFYGTVYGLYSYSSTGSGKITVPALITVFY